MSLSFSARGKVYNNIMETIGETPLVRLNALARDEGCHATVLAKLEFFNPLASAKDRAAMGMIDDAEEKGLLKPGGTIVEATSGNTGIGLAFIATVKGYTLILTMPENMSLERRKLLAFLGAQIVLTPAADGMSGSIKKAEEIIAKTPGAIMAKQFDNPANAAAHAATTAEEIWVDTQGKVDAFAAGIGTGGTVQGVAEGLKAHNANIHIIGAEPASSPVLTKGTSGVHKIQGIGANFVPSILDRTILDDVMDINDDEALVFARRLARQEGILAGISSGASVAAAIRWAKQPETAGKTIVALLPDTAERYLSSELFEE